MKLIVACRTYHLRHGSSLGVKDRVANRTGLEASEFLIDVASPVQDGVHHCAVSTTQELDNLQLPAAPPENININL